MAATVHAVSESCRDTPSACLPRWWKNPYGLVSLWDMVEFLGGNLIVVPKVLGELIEKGFDVDGDIAEGGEEDCRRLNLVFNILHQLGWDDLRDQAQRLLRRAEQGEHGRHMVELTRDLLEAYRRKAGSVHLLVIDQRDEHLLKSACTALAGANVMNAIPAAAEEMNAAGRCLAFGLGTAAVAHAMRAMEASLHVIANELGCQFSGSVIELQDWAALTKKIKADVQTLQLSKRSPDKTLRLQLLGELAIESDCFAGAWRNHVAHARQKYGEAEARVIVEHTGRFLGKLTE